MPRDITVLSLSDRDQWEDNEVDLVMPSQCWRFSHAVAASGIEPKLAIIQAEGSRMLMPFLERSGQGHTDIATLPGLSGASINPPSSAPLALWREFAAGNGWVSGYIQLSAETHPNVTPDARPVARGHMFLVNPQEWEIDRTPSRIIQRKAAAALRAGAVITHDRPALSVALGRLYPETLARFGATPPVSAATVEAWTRDPRNLLVGVSRDNHVEAVHLIHLHNEFAEFHLAGVSPQGRPWSALLYAGVLERLKALGVTRCNLGGGGSPGDGLYRFKDWLGGRAVPLQSIRHVYDVERFAEICTRFGVSTDSPWFPPYSFRTGQTGNASRTDAARQFESADPAPPALAQETD
jgi:hypothetical protein